MSPADLELLSKRERAVLDLAVDGRTDEQISQALDLSVCTVNSYWVRVRGKIGQLSRTEIVAAVLRLEYGARRAALEAQVAALEAEVCEARTGQARAEAALAGAGGAAWPLLVLESLPCAAPVAHAPRRRHLR